MTEPPRVIGIAGPNGAGKTTFAREYLPNEGRVTNFVNADLIAAGLSPFAPARAAIEAGRLMLRHIARYVEARQSFALETTLSGLGHARQVFRWRAAGFYVELIFLRLADADLAVERVGKRVMEGGHDKHQDVVRRRCAAGLRNFEMTYKGLVDEWELFENSGPMPVGI